VSKRLRCAVGGKGGREALAAPEVQPRNLLLGISREVSLFHGRDARPCPNLLQNYIQNTVLCYINSTI